MEENNLENQMALQEISERDFEENLEYMEKTEETYFDEELLQQLREIRDTAQMDLAVREGYENYKVSNVIHYNKDVTACQSFQKGVSMKKDMPPQRKSLW